MFINQWLLCNVIAIELSYVYYHIYVYYRYRAPECLLTDCYIIAIEPLKVY